MMLAIAKRGILVLLLISIGQAEERTPLPAPYLRPDGSKPPGQENQFVFLLPSSGDAVAIYPRIREDGSADPTNIVKVQVALSRHVEPMLFSHATVDQGAGMFEYSYLLSNGKSAGQNVWRWFFEYLTDMDAVSVTAPKNWNHHFPKVKIGSMPVPVAARQQDLVFRALEIFASDGSGFARPTLGVRPGAWQDGLKLRSRRRPGLLNVYVQGGLAIPAFPDEPPEEVSNQMGAVIRSLYNYRHTFCFGPRFDEKANVLTVAKAFAADLDTLISAEALEPSSSFVVGGKDLLTRISPNIGEAELDQIRAWAKSARTDAERQFAEMFLLALSKS
jgi:hypothetical protein